MILTGKTAVITGAASGIGLAIAEKCFSLGMKLALSDINSSKLQAVSRDFTARGASVIAVAGNVASEKDMKDFADQTHSEFGPAFLLFNNAGVSGGGNTWEVKKEDWEWALGANLWGVIHGVNLFVPNMIEANEGHVINTASIAGLIHVPGICSYNTTKAAVVAYSETLFGDFRNGNHDIGVTVVCPSFVNTGIYKSDDNRPDEMKAHWSEEEKGSIKEIQEVAAEFFQNAMSSEDIVDMVFNAINKKEFYVLTHEGTSDRVKTRMEGIINNTPPSFTSTFDFPGV